MKKALAWILSIFEDHRGSASSKRFVLFICMYFLFLLTRGSIDGKTVNQDVLFTIAGIILFCIGAVTSEFFVPKKQD
jgi:hypothetical protein